MPVSYSPNLGLVPQPKDLVIITTGQSQDMFWGPVACVTAQPNCYYFNPFASLNSSQWTLNQGRDSLWNGIGGSDGYLYPGDTQANFPPLQPGQYRGGSPWTWFMQFFASTPSGLAPTGATRLIIAQCGQHGAGCGAWVPGLPNHQRVIDVYNKLKSYGWCPHYINVRQGESDALGMTSAAVYKDTWREAVEGWRDCDIDIPVIFDRSTLARLTSAGLPAGPNFEAYAPDWAARLAKIKSEQNIRQAQLDVLSDSRKIYRGIDCDMIHNRIDGCHDSSDGQALIAYWRYAALYDHVSAGRIDSL